MVEWSRDCSSFSISLFDQEVMDVGGDLLDLEPIMPDGIERQVIQSGESYDLLIIACPGLQPLSIQRGNNSKLYF